MDAGRVLITGGTGFVGRALVPALAASGRPVTLATRRPITATKSTILPVTVGEIGPETDWSRALLGAETVIHLAAHVHVAPERAVADSELFDRVNHLGTVRLFEAAARAGVRRFVFLSSVTVLGARQEAGQPFTDASSPAPDTPYGRSKWAAEQALATRATGAGMALTVLRPPLICGEGVGGNLGALLRLAASPLPLPFGAIRNRRTLLSLDNLVSAIRTILDHPAPAALAGTFLLGDRAPVSTAEIVTILRQGLGRPPGLLPVPPDLLSAGLRLVGRFGMAQRLLGDLAVDSSRFRAVSGWQDVTDTRTALLRAAEAWR